MRLIHDATASTVEPGTTIHLVSGPKAGQAWRFEKITEHATDGHRVLASRLHPKFGRIHWEFHPELFGCSVEIDVHWYADRQRVLRAVGHAATTAVSAFTAAVVAWLVHEYGNAEWGGVLAVFGVHAGT
ncbi:hypothetical protein ABZ896_17540 [Streptomyces sp. NPDC047072]|uniref:hypothetical protein n=1 Tax=Streptomyces sp. NPDC047072 TaxID=3154809 RepID=UPI0033C9745D